MVIETMASKVHKDWTPISVRGDLRVYREDTIHLIGNVPWSIYHLVDGDTPVGRIDVYPKGGNAHIVGSFIKESHRGLGFGRFFYVSMINDQVQMERRVLSDRHLSPQAERLWIRLVADNPTAVTSPEEGLPYVATGTVQRRPEVRVRRYRRRR